MFYVYILFCADGGYYTGCTQDMEERILRHNNGYVDATRLRKPVQLVYYSSFTDKSKAFAFEKYLKTGSGITLAKKGFSLLPRFTKNAG